MAKDRWIKTDRAWITAWWLADGSLGERVRPGHCWVCWATSHSLDRAHLLAQAVGGADEPSNLVLACRACNLKMLDTASREAALFWVLATPERDRFVPQVHHALQIVRFVDLAGIEALRLVPGIPTEMEPWTVYHSIRGIAEHLMAQQMPHADDVAAEYGLNISGELEGSAALAALQMGVLL